MFLFGGAKRSDRPRRVPLAHGDVVVWGGPARLRFHGVLPLEDGHHPRLGGRRINLTFRKAGSRRLHRAPGCRTPLLHSEVRVESFTGAARAWRVMDAYPGRE